MKAVPIELKECQEFINRLHRHHMASHRDKFRVGCEVCGVLVGVAQVGRPVARPLDDGKTLEVTRLCTDGTANACSFLYSRCARIAKEMGYEKIITYILETEDGASLKACGWHMEEDGVGGGDWDLCSRRHFCQEQQLSMFEQKRKYPVGVKKQRWSKKL